MFLTYEVELRYEVDMRVKSMDPQKFHDSEASRLQQA